jgi:hypothetical protein
MSGTNGSSTTITDPNRSRRSAGGGDDPFPPGVLSSYRNGWHQLWKYILELFVIGLIFFFIALPG